MTPSLREVTDDQLAAQGRIQLLLEEYRTLPAESLARIGSLRFVKVFGPTCRRECWLHLMVQLAWRRVFLLVRNR